MSSTNRKKMNRTCTATLVALTAIVTTKDSAEERHPCIEGAKSLTEEVRPPWRIEQEQPLRYPAHEGGNHQGLPRYINKNDEYWLPELLYANH